MSQGTHFVKGQKPLNRRRSERLPWRVPILVRGLDDYGDEILDLTKTSSIIAVGAYLASPRHLLRKQFLSLRIPAPSPSSVGLVPEVSPRINARVLRERPLGGIRVVALEFGNPLI